MKQIIHIACLAVLAATPLTSKAEDDMPDPKSILQADLIAYAPGKAGEPITVGVRFNVAPKWHIYWKNPGESGLATTIKLELPEGWSQGDLQYPAPVTFEAPGPMISF